MFKEIRASSLLTPHDKRCTIRPTPMQSYTGALRPGSGTLPAGRLSRRAIPPGRVRRRLAIVSAAAFALTLIVSGPGHLFLILAALLLIAVLVATLAAERQLRATAQAVARVGRSMSVEAGDDPRAAFDGVLRELLVLFEATEIVFIARPDGQARLYRRGIRGTVPDPDGDRELTADEERRYAFAAPGEMWSAAAAPG